MDLKASHPTRPLPEIEMTSSDEKIVARAVKILRAALANQGELLTAPSVVKRYLTLRLARKEHEVFGALWLNAKNELIADEDMFPGTLTQTSVYPREVVKKSLHHNAASIICYHNHPSGSPIPSAADKCLTMNLQNALRLVEVRLLDHIIVGGLDSYSFAEHGQL
jgi:DNA repair protein RadC